MSDTVSGRPRSGPMTSETSETWQGDPTILVFAVRYALGRTGSHVGVLVAGTVRVNARQIPAGTRIALVRDMTAWLDTVGVDAPASQRDPWVQALAALGVVRKTFRMETPAEPAVAAPRRRRADQRRAS